MIDAYMVTAKKHKGFCRRSSVSWWNIQGVELLHGERSLKLLTVKATND